MAQERVFPIVGIGASAGGVEALEGLFRHMPADTGMAFVLVTHMPRSHPTALSEIIGRHTPMPVSNIRHDETIEPNHVYVCPADHVATVVDGQLVLEARTSEVQRKPIDVFLSSLAEARGENAIGVILSGGGSDGALGIKAIKEHGGVTLAQGGEGSGPKQPSMPETAIATGFVDLVLPVEDMPDRLRGFAKSNELIDEFVSGEHPPVGGEELVEVQRTMASILRNQVGHDFSGYKEKTFMRRVRRRMQIVREDDVGAYVERLRKEPDEVTLLFRDLLIGVTNFFRDKEAFEALQQLVIPSLFEGVGAGDMVRIWVPGCATGEEVYSLAIVMREHMTTLRSAPKVNIFATDIDDAALAVARAGRYPHALLDAVTPHRLERFFTHDDASYTVVREIREMCVFSSHSVIRDPPFSRIDLISCRNLLIYLGAEFQRRVIPTFHFALRPGGYLFLGTSENISQYSELFQRIDKKQRLFQRRDHATSPLQFSSFAPAMRAMSGVVDPRREPAAPPANLRRTVESRVLENFAPPHVVVNRDGDIVHYSSRTGRYLEAAVGMPTRQLMAAARRGLRLDLRSAFQEALETRRTVVRERVAVEIDDRVQNIRLTVEPLGHHEDDPLFVILFSDVGAAQTHSEAAAGRASGGMTGEQLESELRETRERLQTTVEEYETALEELKAANEEMVSINEELQSTNEELETSKEELQSVNEEVNTVNAELSNKIDELDHANADLRSVFESTQIATVFLDGDLVIRSFTPASTAIFNLISTDRGRPLTDIVSQLAEADLRREIRTVLERGEKVERPVRRSDGDGTQYLMRILPYHGRNNVIEGVVVTFVDITKLVEAEARQRTLVEELNHRVRNMLTVVSAIANQTLKKSGSPEQFVKSFLGRIQSLAASYSLLSREQWGDAQLRDIVLNELGLHREDSEDRIVVDGPAVAFKPSSALALGLVLHELTTNATKYGALSTAKGRVSVTWKMESRSKPVLLVTWRETNGPRVRKPKRRGFGTELIEREASNSLGGRVDVDYAQTGLTVRLTIPLNGGSIPGASETNAGRT